MIGKIEKQQQASDLKTVLFDDQTLLMAMKHAQTMDIPVNQYYLILTGTGEIYDDFGEEISLEKIRQAVINKSRLVTSQLDSPDETLINAYRQSDSAARTTQAALIKIESTESFDSQKFSVTSCSIFKTIEPRSDIHSPTTSKQDDEKPRCNLM
ncbi:hypothetical protein [Legionella rowbothamii]|uniref:hypothetical protein n=1 Tax=Legionella rowbothamii TaxID=96229 RepID=UPI00105476C0|nr:hypothetical protein [Legionella rowbothamii]